MNYVFYKGALLLQYEPARMSFSESLDVRAGLPVGSYVFNTESQDWYVVNGPDHSSWRDLSDVPTEYRTYLLLLT